MVVTEIVKYYGCHLTKSALTTHLSRDIGHKVKLLKDAVAKGQEPADVVLVEGIPADRTGKGQAHYHLPSYTIPFSYCLFSLGIVSDWSRILMLLQKLRSALTLS